MLAILGSENEIPILESIWKQNLRSDGEVGWRALRAAEQISLEALKRRTERERLLEETRGFIVHEFRHALSPLNAYVKMLTEALNQPELDKERLEALSSRIHQQTSAAFDIVNQYINYSRPLRPKFQLKDMNRLIRHCLSEFRAKFDDQGVTVHTFFTDQVYAEVDELLIRQVLRNLIDNALQAMSPGGSLEIETIKTEGSIMVRIGDNGRGIKPEHLASVFDLGFTTLHGVQGAGIGLALSKRLIEQGHNGSIAILNNTDDSGVTVTLTLPIKHLETTDWKAVPYAY